MLGSVTSLNEAPAGGVDTQEFVKLIQLAGLVGEEALQIKATKDQQMEPVEGSILVSAMQRQAFDTLLFGIFLVH